MPLDLLKKKDIDFFRRLPIFNKMDTKWTQNGKILLLWVNVWGILHLYIRKKGGLSDMDKKKIQFKYFDPKAKEVYLAGDFNNWNPQKKLMKKQENGEWVIRVLLDPGKVEYKYVVDGKWVNDPGAKEYSYNGVGTQNSVKVV